MKRAMLLGLLLAAVGLHAAWLTRMECYVDSNPTPVLSFTNADTTLAEWTQDACTTLTDVGLHRMKARVTDSEGRASLFTTRLCYVCPTPAVSLDRVEYYYDDDTSQTGSLPLAHLSGALWEVNSTITIPEDMEIGLHLLHVRACDDNGAGSLYTTRSFFATQDHSTTLDRLEYCFDGAYDQVQSLPLSHLADDVWMLDGELNTPVEPGLHLLEAWAVNSDGERSLRAQRNFVFTPAASHNVTRFQWYYTGSDADSTLYVHSVTSPATDVTEDIVASLAALTPGEEYLLHLTAVQDDGTCSFEHTYSFICHYTLENLRISINGAQIVLSWDEAPGADYYLVERKTDPEADGEWFQTTGTTYTVEPTTDKEFYRVKAVRD